VSLGGTLVLLYHRVAHLKQDPHGLAVRPDRFTEHCDILRRRCDVVPLREATRSVRQVSITFDDGYADNFTEARGILAAAGLPATFFITTGWVGKRREAWWDRLAQVVLECETRASAIELEIGRRRLWADIRSAAARERTHLALFWRLRPTRLAAIDAALDDIEAQLGVRSVDRETYRWMDVEELRALAASDGVHIGAHTVTHPFLVHLDAEEQRREIEGGRQLLDDLLDGRANLFSYPYGGPDAFDTVTTGLVRTAGYTIACTAVGGIAHADCDPLQIPRNVVGDWEAERFEKWLDRWLTTA